MEKYIEKETTKNKVIKNINPKILHSHKNLKNNSNKLIKPKKHTGSKLPKKDEKNKNININSTSLTDWNRIKNTKKIINNLPPIPKLYLKKQIPQNNNNFPINPIKKKQLSCNQEGIEKYTKVVYESKNSVNKKIVQKDSSKCPDIDIELEKDLANDDEDSMRVHIPHMTNKKKYNYFCDFHKIDIKNRNEKMVSDNINMKINDIFEKKKNRLVLLPKSINENKRNQYEKKNDSNKNNKYFRSKTEKKKNENKENKNHNHNYANNYNIYLNNKYHELTNSGNSFIALKKFKEHKNIGCIKKNSDIYNFSNLFSSISSINEEKNKKSNKELNHIIDNKSKTIENYLLNSQSMEKKTHINKKINISLLDSDNIKETNIIKNIPINNLNTNSDFISGKETSDSPENITDREEDKFNLPIHKINHFFISERKRCLEKFNRNSKNNKNNKFYLSPKQNMNFNLNSTDENCFVHKTNMANNYINSNSKNNISSYKKNIKQFQNLTSEKKMPLSLFLTPAKKNNLFKDLNFKIPKINYINIKSNNLTYKKKINLDDLLIDKQYSVIKEYIENYLDKKSLVKLSSLNKRFYKNLRVFLFNYLNESISLNNNENERKKFIMKIIQSIFKYSSKKLKNKDKLKLIYNNYKTKSKYDVDILKDLTRTFPKDNSFSKNADNYLKLYNLLTCYSNYNKDIGYVQGLNFLGAISIIIFESEEKSFLFLDSLINRFELDNFFGIDNKNLITKLMNYSNILNKYIPDIISYLEKQQINHGFFSTGWILTLFSNSMNGEYLNIVWAFMIIFGWKFFYSFVIQILKWYKDDIFNTNINELCIKMKNILSEEKFQLNYHNIIKETFIFMNKNIVL